MTVTVAPEYQPTWNVWHRRNRREPWCIIATAYSKSEAARQMFDLTDNQSGDWLVLETTKPNPNQKRPAWLV